MWILHREGRSYLSPPPVTAPVRRYLAPTRTLHKVYFADNPWHCDCNLQYTQEVFKATNILTLTFPLATVCATPPSQAGKSILEADMSTECGAPFIPEPLDITC